MKVLIIGGTGVISTGIAAELLVRGADVTMINRGVRTNTVSANVTRILCDRTDRAAFERTFERSRYDVVIDMLCFTPDDADSTIRAFGGRCEQLQFCSTVCTYGVNVPPRVLIDESCEQAPISEYGRQKLECERRFERAAEQGRFALTILRPSHTYGPGAPLIDQLELDGGAWDRIERGLPVLCAGDGLGLWQSTHRDDCAKLFAHAALNAKTYGEAYNATGDRVFTWRDYHREAARALDTEALLVFVPTEFLLRRAPARFGFLRETTQFHGAYSSEKAKAAVPEFRSTIDFETGARETFADLKRRRAWRDSREDEEYQRLVDKALSFGLEVTTA